MNSFPAWLQLALKTFDKRFLKKTIKAFFLHVGIPQIGFNLEVQSGLTTLAIGACPFSQNNSEFVSIYGTSLPLARLDESDKLCPKCPTDHGRKEKDFI